MFGGMVEVIDNGDRIDVIIEIDTSQACEEFARLTAALNALPRDMLLTRTIQRPT